MCAQTFLFHKLRTHTYTESFTREREKLANSKIKKMFCLGKFKLTYSVYYRKTERLHRRLDWEFGRGGGRVGIFLLHCREGLNLPRTL